MKSKKRASFSYRNFLSLILFCIAFGVLLYPLVANVLVNQQTQKIVTKVNTETSMLSPQETHQLLTEAETYNAYLYSQSQKIRWTQKKPSYNAALVVDSSGMIGDLSIPQLHLSEVPIYHGDSENTLALGIG